jgi:phosphoglycolate phosphatase
LSDIDFNSIQAVLFDFDGTLVHLNIDFAQMRTDVEAVLPGYGLSTDGKEPRYTLELIEDCVEELIKRGTPEDEEPFRRDVEAAMTAIELGAAESAEAHPGAAELLQALRERGTRVGIVTRNCRAAVEHILSKSPLPYDALLTRDDVVAVKPDPAHLVIALRMLGVEPQHALMVGDHPMDIRAGRLVGAKTVAVLTGYSPKERFLPEAPDLILERVGELGTHLTT